MRDSRLRQAKDKVRTYLLETTFTTVTVEFMHHELHIPKTTLSRVFSDLGKEGILGSREKPGWPLAGHSYYTVIPAIEKSRAKMAATGDLLEKADYAPRKMRSSWGNKKRLLTIIRKTKPWVIEKWWPVEDRWFLYMANCRTGEHQRWGCNDEQEVSPEDQPDLSRREIARWHFDLEGAMRDCASLRRRFPKENFRIRDTSAGDYIMGAVL